MAHGRPWAKSRGGEEGRRAERGGEDEPAPGSAGTRCSAGPAVFAGSSLLGNWKHGKRPKWSVTEINHDFRNQEAWGGGLVFQSGPVSDWLVFISKSWLWSGGLSHLSQPLALGKEKPAVHICTTRSQFPQQCGEGVLSDDPSFYFSCKFLTLHSDLTSSNTLEVVTLLNANRSVCGLSF